MTKRWQYYIEDTEAGYLREVFPLNTRSLRIKEVLEDEYIHDYRKSLEGSIVLWNDYKNNHLDYDFMKELEATKLHEKLTFQMHDGGILAFTGEFTILDCKFNERQGICEFQVQPVDDYTYIQENEDVEVNVLDGLPEKMVSAEINSYWHFYIKTYFTPEVEKDEPYGLDVAYEPIYFNISPYSYVGTVYLHVTELLHIPVGDTPPAGWTLYVEMEDYRIYQRYPVNFPYTWDINLMWTGKRFGSLYSAVLTDSSDYEIIDIDFAYSATSRPDLLCTRETETPPHIYNMTYYNPSVVYGHKDIYSAYANTSVTTRYYIARTLKDTLNKILSYAMPDFPEIKSTLLFGDPAESGKALSPDYTSLQFSSDLDLIQISDFLKPFASEAARKGILTWKQAIEYLCDKHNARWFIDADNNIRFEHILYFEITEETDISSNRSLTLSYDYLANEKPNREYMEESQAWSEDFAKIDVLYGTVPILAGSTEKTTSHNLSKFFTDIDGMNIHLDELGTEGFVYVEVSDGAVVKATGFKSAKTGLQNADLSNANCLNRFYRYDAYQQSFYIAGKAVSALTLKRMKKQELTFMLDSPLDVKKKFSTPIGVGVISELSYAPTQEVFYENAIIIY